MTNAQELLLNSLYFLGIGWHSKQAIFNYNCIVSGHQGEELKKAFETPITIYSYIFVCVIIIIIWPVRVIMAWGRDLIITRL